MGAAHDGRHGMGVAHDSRRRGMGVALYMHGTGFTGSGEAKMKSLVGMNLLPDGRVEILTASTDMGQGTATVFSQIVAKTLGIDYDRVFMAPVDTSRVPDSGPTVASRTVTIVGSVVAGLAEALRTRVLEFAAKTWGGSPADYRLEDHWLMREGHAERIASFADLSARLIAEEGPVSLMKGYQLSPDIHWDEEEYRGDAYPAFSWGCTIAEVAVDPDTLEVELTKMTAVHDIGTLIHPVLAAGQVEGGLVQAIGYGLTEEVVWRDGAMVNHGFTNYIIPTALDIPELEVGFVENPYSGGPFGAKGVGEIPMNGAAPALANAVAHAVGAQVDVLPVTPERILAALQGARPAGGLAALQGAQPAGGMR
jgi:CO/xanthine dehydrogenase Mo-binding subunit